MEKNIRMDVYVCIIPSFLPYTAYINTVNQSYFHKINFLKNKTNKKLARYVKLPKKDGAEL